MRRFIAKHGKNSDGSCTAGLVEDENGYAVTYADHLWETEKLKQRIKDLESKEDK